MRWKREYPLIFFVLIVMLVNPLKLNALEDDFQKMTVKITSINWKLVDYYDDYDDYSLFDLDIDFTIFNPNNYIVNITYTVGYEFYRVDITASFSNRKMKLTIFEGGLYQAAETTLMIENGLSEKHTDCLIGFNELNLINLPDGTYIVWIYLWLHGETHLNSIRAKMTINEGIPSFNYNLTPTIKLANQFNFVIISLLLAVVLIVFKKQKK